MFYIPEHISMTILSSLITSKMRIYILMRLFLNASEEAHLRELATEFGASPSQVKEEVENLAAAGLLECRRAGRMVKVKANTRHPLFPELQSMVGKSLGMDRILDSIVSRLGNLQRAVLIDDYAQGRDTGIIDLVLVGDVDRGNLDDLVGKTEKYLKRKIRVLVVTESEFRELARTLGSRPQLVIWSAPGERMAGTTTVAP